MDEMSITLSYTLACPHGSMRANPPIALRWPTATGRSWAKLVFLAPVLSSPLSGFPRLLETCSGSNFSRLAGGATEVLLKLLEEPYQTPPLCILVGCMVMSAICP